MEHNDDAITRTVDVYISVTMFGINNPNERAFQGFQMLQVTPTLPNKVLNPWIVRSTAFPCDPIAIIVMQIKNFLKIQKWDGLHQGNNLAY